MDPGQRKRKLAVMSSLCGVAALYCFFAFLRLNGLRPWMSGSAGVLLGLFIASLPAANFLDMLLYGRFMTWTSPSRFALLWWITYNTLVLVVGGLVVTVGAMQLSG